VAASIGETQAAIFDAHLLILEDPEIEKKVRESIFEGRDNASLSWRNAIDAVTKSYQDIDDPYLKGRAVDVEDVGAQVLHNLAGSEASLDMELTEEVILIADELTPTQTAQLNMDHVLALVTVGGGPTSHSAILARALGIPAIAGADPSVTNLEKGTELAVDGFKGLLYIDPQESTRGALLQKREAWVEERESLREASEKPAVTRDGHAVEVVANVGSPEDAQAAVQHGAEGIGLLRTEFLFLTRDRPPTEDEQVEVLKQIGDVMGSRPVIIRTLDVGGDKALPYLEMVAEANPFLGVRAIRLSLEKPKLFKTQLRAILRAGAGKDFRIMFPMITSVSEVRQASALLETVHQSLEEEGVEHLWPIETGIMIETPAAALLSAVLGEHVDFFSIGTNDLTQYTMAAERGNPSLSALADALNPAVLQLIQTVVKAAQDHGRWTGVCGELAGDPIAVPILVGLGVEELSLNPAGIPRLKAAIRDLELPAAQSLAHRALDCESAAAVRELVAAFNPSN
jgi:phosphocarrier protein FPr